MERRKQAEKSRKLVGSQFDNKKNKNYQIFIGLEENFVGNGKNDL